MRPEGTLRDQPVDVDGRVGAQSRTSPRHRMTPPTIQQVQG